MRKDDNLAKDFMGAAQDDIQFRADAVAAEVCALIMNIDAYQDRIIFCKGTERKMKKLGLSREEFLSKMKTESQIRDDAPLWDSGYFYHGDHMIGWVTSYKNEHNNATLEDILDPHKRRAFSLRILVQVMHAREKPRPAPYILESFEDLRPQMGG